MLYVVATPIGDEQELSPRALQVLKDADIIICEGTKETSKLLRAHGVAGKKYEVLDEHSKKEDLPRLLELCQTLNCALVTDCGTPGFCDPGSDLVGLCRSKNVTVKTILGPSALMGLLSLAGRRFDQFVFRGFLPAETEARKLELIQLKTESRAIIIMDTPYRLKKTLQDMKDHFADREFLLALNLTQESETVLEGKIEKVAGLCPFEKAEFMLLIYPRSKAK